MNGWEANWNRDVLERIVALLFALAGLADLAAGAPYLRRRRVLEILGNGEAEARAFLIGISTGAPTPACAAERAGDAARIAIRLRALALVLCAMLAHAALFALPGSAAPRADRRKAAAPAGYRASLSAPDTS
jgi:hypothetical protein